MCRHIEYNGISSRISFENDVAVTHEYTRERLAVFSFYIIQKGSSPERYSAQPVYCMTRDLWMSEVIVFKNQKGAV